MTDRLEQANAKPGPKNYMPDGHVIPTLTDQGISRDESSQPSKKGRISRGAARSANEGRYGFSRPRAVETIGPM